MIFFSFPIHRQLLIQRLTGTIPSIAIRRTRVVLPAWRGPASISSCYAPMFTGKLDYYLSKLKNGDGIMQQPQFVPQAVGLFNMQLWDGYE